MVGIGKNKSESEIKAVPDGKNDLSLLMSVGSFRLNGLKVGWFLFLSK